jgi:hypothetical protein
MGAAALPARLAIRRLPDRRNVADAKTGLYAAAIPGAFIDPKWDPMYFVEAVGKDGAGRMYPDLEREMPYVIVSVKR